VHKNFQELAPEIWMETLRMPLVLTEPSIELLFAGIAYGRIYQRQSDALQSPTQHVLAWIDATFQKCIDRFHGGAASPRKFFIPSGTGCFPVIGAYFPALIWPASLKLMA
jgi:hypothetical protein